MSKTDNLLQWIELAETAFSHNVASLSKLAGNRKLAVCVKANAYGHGLSEIISLLSKNDKVHYVTVHSLEEAVAARESGWSKEIMLLGPLAKGCEGAVIDFNLEPVVSDRGALERILKIADKVGFKVKTHLKLETGTNRQGFADNELESVAKTFQKYPSLGGPYGASTHFANIEDTTNHAYAQHQLDRFNQMVKRLTALKIKPSIRHTASSAAMILFDKTRFELVRPGISLYGHWPSKETYLSYRLQGGDNDLFKPVLSWKGRVSQVKSLPADSFIGYGCTYRTTTPTKLAIVPIGYADGYDRALSNLAYLLIKGKRAPIRGRICMNLLMADITHIKSISAGEEVILIGGSSTERITAEQLASWSGSINYEVLARISASIPKILMR